MLNADAAGGASFTKAGETVAVTKQLQPEEHFFGFGERMDFLDQRNKKLRLDVDRGKDLPYHVGAYNVLEANKEDINLTVQL